MVKGIPQPVRTERVHRAKPRACRVASRGIEGVETGMVGRDDELASLRRSFAASYTDPGLRSVTVVADPDAVPEVGVLCTALQQELDAYAYA